MLSEDQTVQAEYKAVLKNLTIKSRTCFDCGANNPSWGVIHFGLFVCFDCAGKHRSMGTHISFVRSTTFDQWSEHNMKKMVSGGNAKATEYFGKYGMRIGKCKSHVEFYDGKVARRYKEIIEREAQKIELKVSPKLTPKTSFFSHGLDDMIGDLNTAQESGKRVQSKSSTITPSSKAANEMAAIFNNMVVSASKPKKPSPSTKKITPLTRKIAKLTKPKRNARFVSVAQDDDSSDDDFEAEMADAKTRKKPLSSPEPVTKEDDEFVMGFGPNRSNPDKKERVETKKSGTCEVKAVFENKYGKNRGTKSMKSISSADFQNNDNTQQLQRGQFRNATSIGSDAFFGREVPTTGDSEFSWEDVRSDAINKAQQLKNVASNWFSSVGDNL